MYKDLLEEVFDDYNTYKENMEFNEYSTLRRFIEAVDEFTRFDGENAQDLTEAIDINEEGDIYLDGIKAFNIKEEYGIYTEGDSIKILLKEGNVIGNVYIAIIIDICSGNDLKVLQVYKQWRDDEDKFIMIYDR